MFQDTKYAKITIASFKVGLLLVLILYLASVNLFHHRHIIDGQIILHSHLHSGSEGDSPAHSHTKAEIQSIQHLMIVETTGSASPSYVIAGFQDKPVILFFETYRPVIVSDTEDCFFLRPPPVV